MNPLGRERARAARPRKLVGANAHRTQLDDIVERHRNTGCSDLAHVIWAEADRARFLDLLGTQIAVPGTGDRPDKIRRHADGLELDDLVCRRVTKARRGRANGDSRLRCLGRGKSGLPLFR